MSKGLFDKASSYREEFLARPNEGLLAQALDYLNSKDKTTAEAEMKSSGEPILPPLPDASEFHPIDDPTVADIMPDEETVRQRMAEIEEQVCAAENETSAIDSTNSIEQSETKSEETFFLEGNEAQEQQPDYEEEVLIIDLPKDDDPFVALMAQMSGDTESVQTEQEDVIPTEANEMSEAETTETDEEESPVEEVTQGTSFVGNDIVYDADIVTQKTFTDNNVSFTKLPPIEEPAPDYEDDLPSGILTTEQSEDDAVTVPAADEEEDMAELPAAEDLPAAADESDESENIPETDDNTDFAEDENIEWLYPADSYENNETETIDNSQSAMHNEEDSSTDSLNVEEEPAAAEESENADTSTEETEALVEENPSADENASKQYDDYLAVLDDISAQTASIAVDENMFDNFLYCIADRFEIDRCGLLLFDPDDGQFKCMAKIDYDDETEEKLSFDLNYNDIYGNLANKKSYLVHRDEPQFGGLADIMSEKDFAEAQYQLWLPFVFSSRIIGIMLVTHSIEMPNDNFIRALEVAGRLNGATLYNLYQQYAVMCEEYEDDEVDAETLAEENEEELYNEEETSADDEILKQNEVTEEEKSADGETAESDAENSSDDEKELSEEELAEELMSEWDIAASSEVSSDDEKEESDNSSPDDLDRIIIEETPAEEEEIEELEAVHNEEDSSADDDPETVQSEQEDVISSEVSEADKSDESESDEEVQAEIPSVIEDETDKIEAIPSVIEEEAESDEGISSADENESVEIQDDTIIESSPEELAEAELAIEAAITDDVIEAEYTIPSDDETAGGTDSIIIDESSFGEGSETIHNSQCIMHNGEESEESIEELEKVEESVISTEANEESETEKSTDSESIIIEDTGLALPEDEPIEVLPIPDDLDAKYRGLATFMHDLRETGAALSLCRVILTSFADVTAAVGEFSLGSFAEDIKGTTQSIIGGDSFVEVTDPDKFYIVLPNAEKEEAQAAAEMIIEQIVGLFSEAFGNAAEFRFECAANDTFTQSDYLSLLNELS